MSEIKRWGIDPGYGDPDQCMVEVNNPGFGGPVYILEVDHERALAEQAAQMVGLVAFAERVRDWVYNVDGDCVADAKADAVRVLTSTPGADVRGIKA